MTAEETLKNCLARHGVSEDEFESWKELPDFIGLVEAMHEFAEFRLSEHIQNNEKQFKKVQTINTISADLDSFKK